MAEREATPQRKNGVLSRCFLTIILTLCREHPRLQIEMCLFFIFFILYATGSIKRQLLSNLEFRLEMELSVFCLKINIFVALQHTTLTYKYNNNNIEIKKNDTKGADFSQVANDNAINEIWENDL